MFSSIVRALQGSWWYSEKEEVSFFVWCKHMWRRLLVNFRCIVLILLGSIRVRPKTSVRIFESVRRKFSDVSIPPTRRLPASLVHKVWKGTFRQIKKNFGVHVYNYERPGGSRGYFWVNCYISNSCTCICRRFAKILDDRTSLSIKLTYYKQDEVYILILDSGQILNIFVY